MAAYKGFTNIFEVLMFRKDNDSILTHQGIHYFL